MKADFKNNSFEIQDSNVFFKSEDDEVLFINKIINMKYLYDLKNLNNIVVSKNEIFNISKEESKTETMKCLTYYHNPNR